MSQPLVHGAGPLFDEGERWFIEKVERSLDEIVRSLDELVDCLDRWRSGR